MLRLRHHLDELIKGNMTELNLAVFHFALSWVDVVGALACITAGVVLGACGIIYLIRDADIGPRW